MKKIILSIFIIETFIIYAYYVHIHKIVPTPLATEQKIVTKKVSTRQNSSTPTITEVQPKNSLYKNGIYIGSIADAVYGNIQVQVTITSGKIAKINFLQYPHDQETSIAINQQDDPVLAQEAIQAQTANVDIVSGATQSSMAFIQSLQSALAKAKFNGA